MRKFILAVLTVLAAGAVACSGGSSDGGTDPSVTKTLFTIIDSTKSYSNVCFKGTASSWALLPMYDDGTHGDLTAGDNTWSIEIAVIEDGEWGAVENDGSANGVWLLASGEANRAYTVASDGSVSGDLSYTVPLPTTKATITFTVDDSANQTYTDINFNGSGISWTAVDMYDDGTHGDVTSGDHIWTVVLTVPTGEWGFLEGTEWKLPVSNLTYTVADDGSVSGTTSYVIQ